MNKVNRRDFLTGAGTLAAVAGCRSAKVESSAPVGIAGSCYDPAKVRFNAEGEFRFLQLTDVHLQSCEGRLPMKIKEGPDKGYRMSWPDGTYDTEPFCVKPSFDK